MIELTKEKLNEIKTKHNSEDIDILVSEIERISAMHCPMCHGEFFNYIGAQLKREHEDLKKKVEILESQLKLIYGQGHVMHAR